MGALFLARDPAIDRLLAIKLLRRGFDSDELRSRFAREAKPPPAASGIPTSSRSSMWENTTAIPSSPWSFAGETLQELIRHGARLSSRGGWS